MCPLLIYSMYILLPTPNLPPTQTFIIQPPLTQGLLCPSAIHSSIHSFILAVLGLSCRTRDLRCCMRNLCCGMHVGSSSPTRNRTGAPCVGSVESYPLDHQGSPCPGAFHVLFHLSLQQPHNKE